MAEFRVRPRSHASLQDWLADEKGYFADEGLSDIGLVRQQFDPSGITAEALPVQASGAYDAAVSDPSRVEAGEQRSNVNTFCHWAVNASVGAGRGRMWPHAYSWTVSGIYVPAESKIERPEDLAGVPIAVGKRSGSHFSTVLSLEKYLQPDDINLQFVGFPHVRLGLALEGKLQACNGLGAPCYVLEQNGFRKIIDNGFIQGFLVSGDVDSETMQKYFRALRRAQRDIDLDPEPYKRMVLEHSVPAEFHHYVKNVAALGIPTRIVFEEYTREMYEATQAWVHAHNFFDDANVKGAGAPYAQAMVA